MLGEDYHIRQQDAHTLTGQLDVATGTECVVAGCYELSLSGTAHFLHRFAPASCILSKT